MQEIVHNINLNLSQPNNFEYIHVMQGDYNSEKVVATLFNGNKLYTVDAQKATLQGSTSDGGLILQNNIEISEDKHQVIFEITKEMSSCPGELTCNIVFSSNNQKKSTFPFVIKNTADITGRAPVSVLTTISDYVDRAEKAASDAEKTITEVKEEIVNINSNLTSEISRAKEAEEILKSRVDTITSLPEGSTTGDAELQDIRVKADGTTAASAGNAVREQISELKSDFGNLRFSITENNLLHVERKE